MTVPLKGGKKTMPYRHIHQKMVCAKLMIMWQNPWHCKRNFITWVIIPTLRAVWLLVGPSSTLQTFRHRQGCCTLSCHTCRASTIWICSRTGLSQSLVLTSMEVGHVHFTSDTLHFANATKTKFTCILLCPPRRQSSASPDFVPRQLLTNCSTPLNMRSA